MELNFRQFGESGQNLVILHGLLGSSANWHSAGKKLAEHFQVTVPDLRNHGDSPHAEQTILAIRDDLKELLDDLNIDKTFLLGHSMGGLATMTFAFAYPERLAGLIVVDITPVAQLDQMQPIFDALSALDLKKIFRREDADAQLTNRIPNAMVRQFLLQNLKRHEDGTYNWRCNLAELHRFIKDENRFQLNPGDHYDGPTLFIGGGNSEHKIWEKEDLIRERFPNYKMKILPNVGHWVHFEAMEEFVKIATGFVESNT